MNESNKSILTKMLRDRIAHLEGAIYCQEMLRNKEASEVLKKQLQELLIAYSEVVEIKAL